MKISDIKWWCGCSEERKKTSTDWHLLPLTPEFIDKEHGVYLEALQSALEDPKIRNIALSGQYGVGKSSILQELARSNKNEVLELSLSTLAPLADEGVDDAVPEQAKTTTNRIQQEIVKQLLYREKPSKTPGSRFRRIERFNFFRELTLTCLIAFAITITGLLTGWSSSVNAELLPQMDSGARYHLIVFAFSVFALLIIRWALYGRVQIRQLTAGSATVTLDDHSVSYFDQYLDEIVYFFEVSKRNVVIFEDIDRFNDSLIFETLLALNTLLNAQRGEGKPIRFIYAIKDSIFDQGRLNAEKKRNADNEITAIEDPAKAEAVRANRTKFFDLVIPVVPFITHRSAKNLAWKILERIDTDIEPALTDLAARYIPDMRLIKNARNEFIVFRDRIFSGSGEGLELSETDLFAMMLYKCTHLADFEAISIGRSKIDLLYQAERELISANIVRIQKEIRQLRDKLTNIQNVENQSAILGRKLLRYIEQTVESFHQTLGKGQIVLGGQLKTEEELSKRQFWAEFAEASGDPAIEWRQGNTHRLLFKFPRSVLIEVLNEPLNPDQWDASLEESLKTDIAGCEENLQMLRRAQMGDLIRNPEFKLDFEKEHLSFSEIARKLLDGDDLTYQLIRNGYVNRNFTLYTATYHDNRVSAAAQNFIMLHVERDLMDEHFELTGPDIKGVILECGRTSLVEPALYNIAILDYLLEGDVAAANLMIRSLINFGERQHRFIQAYLNNGRKTTAFIEQFTRVTPRAIKHIVEDIELAQSERLEFLSCALISLDQSKKYVTTQVVREYLTVHYEEIQALTSQDLDAEKASQIADLFAESKIQVPTLSQLAPNFQQSLISNNCFVINRKNLEIALESASDLSLDRAKATEISLYRYLIKDIPAYLNAIGEGAPTIVSPSNFVPIIEDILSEDKGSLDGILDSSSTDCMVSSITEVSEELWTYLAQHNKFPATFENLKKYIDQIGEIDERLITLLLNANAITNHDSFEEKEKHELALVLLSLRNSLLPVSSVVHLVSTLELKHPIKVDDIPADSGEIFALLLEADLIADSDENYAYLTNADWPTREGFIQQSKNFREFMTAELVGKDLANLLRSERVNSSVKDAVLSAASEYAETSDNAGLIELAKFAVRRGQSLSPDLLEMMAVNNVPAHLVVSLLRYSLAAIPYETLASILSNLGDNFGALTITGTDQPTFPDTEENRALLYKLKEYGNVITKVKPTLTGSKLRVHGPTHEK